MFLVILYFSYQVLDSSVLQTFHMKIKECFIHYSSTKEYLILLMLNYQHVIIPPQILLHPHT